jgi:hypothetical protein
MRSSNNGSPHGKPEPDAGDALNEFLLQARKALLPVMVREIPDGLLQPAREAELKRKVETILDAWLIEHKVPIGRQTRLRLLAEILEDIARGSRGRFGE